MPLNLDAYLSEPLQRSLIPALLTVVITLVGRALSPRSRIKWGVSHGFVFAVPQVAPTTAQDDAGGNAPSALVPYHTRTVFVQNMGRAVAELVEVHFNYRPEHMQIWPTLNYDTTTNPENRLTVSVVNLGPREYFTLELLSVRPLPDVLRVRSKAGDGKQIGIAPSEVLPPWYRTMLRVLIWLGVFAIIQNLFLWIYK
jgi:hypothetical protein